MNTLYPPLIIGGAEKSVSLLAEALARAGDKVSVITLDPGRKARTEERNGVNVYRLPLRNIYWPFNQEDQPRPAAKLLWHVLDMWNPRAAHDVGCVLDIERPDVVHTNTISGFSIAIFNEAKRRNIRLVHTLRDYYMLCARYALFRDGHTCESRCTDCKLLAGNRRLLSRRPDAMVANSGHLLDVHQAHGWFCQVPASVIYNVTSSAPAQPEYDQAAAQSTAAPSITASSTGTANPHLVFGFIGKLEPEKGIEILLAATTLLPSASWMLRIAGKGRGSYVAALRARYPEPRIEWLGFAEPSSFYASIDVLVVPSVWAEPLPRSLIEAFAAGRSAICARSGGIPEIAALGRVVETYPSTDPAALGRAIQAALADQDRWRKGGWIDASAEARFSEAAIVERYHRVYNAAPEPHRELVSIHTGRPREMV